MFDAKRKKNVKIEEGGRYLVKNWDDSVSIVTIVHIDEPKDLAVEMNEDGQLLRGSLAILSHEIVKEIGGGGN